MKKLIVMALGMGLALGSVSFAQDSSKMDDSKKMDSSSTKKAKKSKKSKKSTDKTATDSSSKM